MSIKVKDLKGMFTVKVKCQINGKLRRVGDKPFFYEGKPVKHLVAVEKPKK